MAKQKTQSSKEKFWQIYGAIRPGSDKPIGVLEAARLAGVKRGTACSMVFRKRQKEKGEAA